MVEVIKQTDRLTESETRILFGWGENIFGVLPHELTWRPKDLHFVLHADNQPVSHVGLLQHLIRVGEQPLKVAGVGGVVTVPEAQKRGLAQRLMKHATVFMENEWMVDAGLLFCLPKMEAYYARLGWRKIDSPIVFDQPGGKTASPLPVMVLPFGGRPWPKGEVDLESLPW
jgi:GNAT superfamily N-acetyltransferase